MEKTAGGSLTVNQKYPKAVDRRVFARVFPRRLVVIKNRLDPAQFAAPSRFSSLSSMKTSPPREADFLPARRDTSSRRVYMCREGS
jgi:hypothetical protein